MPREQITYEEHSTLEGASQSGTSFGHALVSWVRQSEFGDGHVQLALEVPISYAKLAIGSPNGRTSNHTEMFTPVLTRPELNKFIRTLKRARDAAYGVDE